MELSVDMFNSKFDTRGFYLFFSNAVAQCSLLIILVWSFAFYYFISTISGLLLLLAFFSGVLVISVLWTNKSLHALLFFEFSSKSSNYVIQQKPGCSVCGHSLCKRQKNFKDNQPWIGLNIQIDIDQAIQDLFNKVLNEFVTSWHSKFSKDESFILELRRGLRYAASVLLRRILQVDISEIITGQLLTTSLKHVNDYINISKMSLKENISMEAATVKYLGKKLHPAVHNRKSELQYLRCLSDLLSGYLIPSSQLKCLSFRVLVRELLAGWIFLPLTDTLSDPFCINSLFLLALSYEPLTDYPHSSAYSVQFLHRFVTPNKDFGKKFVLQTNLSAILKDTKLLYTFMQFLKKEGAVHLLQFCLDVEEFSKKILNPELSQSEMENLHKEAWDLYSVYFKIDSPDNVHFPSYIVQQLEQVLENGASNISKLRTNPVLFKAYEVAYSVLEETYCPLFYLSDDFFPLLCGERQKAKFSKDISPPLQPGSPIRGRSNKKGVESTAVGKLSSKFHKLLQFQAVEGKAYFADAPVELAETECAEEMPLEMPQEIMFRDMSTWHVTLPHVTTKQDSNSKPYAVFNINVIDIGTKDKLNQSVKLPYKWNVERKYNDFYLLQAKLAEFHGEFEDGTQLPAKTGMFSPRGSEFLESRRQIGVANSSRRALKIKGILNLHLNISEIETEIPGIFYVKAKQIQVLKIADYLQKLLQKPNLRGSDLLYFFLHSTAEFSSCLSAQEGIGKIIRRSVEPIKLRKERGQHLENFLNVFLASTEGTKRSGKFEWQDVSVTTKRRQRNFTSPIFYNNFHEYIEKAENWDSVQREEVILLGPWDCIFYLMSKLMGASSRVMQGAMTFKNIFGQSADSVIKMFIRKKLDPLLVPSRVSHLIRLLQDALFNSNYQSRKQNYKPLRDEVLLEIEKRTNSVLIHWLLPDFAHGVQEVIDCLQYPLLNKHLCYCLLDEVVRVLFPELATSN